MEKNNKEVASILGSLHQSTHVVLQKIIYLRLKIFYSMWSVMWEAITRQQTTVALPTKCSYKGKKQYGKSVTSKGRTCWSCILVIWVSTTWRKCN